MKILYAASEALPFIASGGLADVAGSLPKALRNQRQACRVVLPLYSDIKQELRSQLKFITELYVPLAWRNQYCGVFEANVGGVIYYLLDNEYYFARKGIYGFYDDAERFAFFSKAVLEMLHYVDFAPDIIHCNDWQTALVPVYLNVFYRNIEKFRNIRTVFTIHNIQYQGKYGMELLGDVLGLPKDCGHILEYGKCLNMMKGAIEEADAVSTVSPTYANEILDPWYSHGLHGILQQRQYKLRGILNGIDYTVYDPASDPKIVKNYTAKTAVTDKVENKREIQREMGLDVGDDRMLIGVVTRLVAHKGIDLIKYIFEQILENDMNIAILGSGDYLYEEFFRSMQARYPGRVGVRIGFIPDLARKMYAGCDVFLMPSKSEPCGLAQMVAAHYGTIPVVRETGGLKDSIVDIDAPEGGNGYTFKSYNAHDMLGALLRAKGLYYNKEYWNKAVVRAMQSDFSWNRSAREYVSMYQQITGLE